jgi:hypothetical protein
MINGIIRRLRARREREAATAALIARRARGSNRKPQDAEAYQRVHSILARGRRS